MNWSSIDGKSWSLTIGDKKARIRLMMDEKTYMTTTWLDGDSRIHGTYDCIKRAKQACMDQIERINAWKESQG